MWDVRSGSSVVGASFWVALEGGSCLGQLFPVFASPVVTESHGDIGV